LGKRPITAENDGTDAAEVASVIAPLTGEHTPSGYVRAVLDRAISGATGEIRIFNGEHERTLYFVDGHLLAITSTVPDEELIETIVTSGLVEASRVEWIETHVGVDEGIIEALLAAGTLSWDELCAHVQDQLGVLLGANLRWATGEWEWVEADHDVARRFDPDLVPDFDMFATLVDGVRSTFAAAALEEWVTDESAGGYIADARLTGAALPSWFPTRLENLPTRLASGADGESLLTTDDDPAFAAALWVVEAVGLLHRRNPPASLIPSDTVLTFRKAAPEPAAEEPSPSASSARPRLPKKIRKKRVAAPKPKAQDAAAAKPDDVPAPEVAAASEAAPSKPVKRRKQKPAKKKLLRVLTFPEVQTLIEDGDFETAFVHLQKLRDADPSSPDILAALGWAAWRSEAHGTNAYDGPEDFLLLALTFDPEHPKSLEYFARIAIETGDIESARNRLLQVLQADPDAGWAREALESDALSAQTRANRGRGLRFWPRGKA
jgi:hypothetical protein